MVPLLTIQPAALAAGSAGVAYTPVTLTALGGKPGYTWDGLGGKPSAGYVALARRSLGGTPQAAGTFNFTVQVQDNTFGRSQTATLNLALAVNSAITITTPSQLPGGLPARLTA